MTLPDARRLGRRAQLGGRRGRARRREHCRCTPRLLVLGTVLMALAGWTFLPERRSLERRATTDELTGLANRREFERQTDEALLVAARFNTGLCVMLIDLNGFKQINDTLGHQFGDLVLRGVADRLERRPRHRPRRAVGRRRVRHPAARLEDGTAVRASAERIAGHWLHPVVNDVTVTAAIGAALYPRHGETLDELVRAADVAMYSAKTTGVTHRLADVHDRARRRDAPTSTSDRIAGGLGGLGSRPRSLTAPATHPDPTRSRGPIGRTDASRVHSGRWLLVDGALTSRLAGFGTTIFAEMSALAVATGAINLGQGFPDTDGPTEVLDAAVDAIRRGVNQYPPGPGRPGLRNADRRPSARFYGVELDPDTRGRRHRRRDRGAGRCAPRHARRAATRSWCSSRCTTATRPASRWPVPSPCRCC